MYDYQNRRKFSLIFAVFLALSLALLIILSAVKEKSVSRKGEKGLFIPLKKNSKGHVTLEGPMEFYWMRLLTPEDFDRKQLQDPPHLKFPDTWNNNTYHKEQLPGKGYATYRSHLYFDTTGTLAFKLKDYCNSYKLWINGNLIAQGGVPGKKPVETVPVKVNRMVPFSPQKGANELILQTANFHEKYGGFREKVLVGTFRNIKETSNHKKVIDSFVLGILFVTFLYYTGLFLHPPRNKSYLLFGMLVFFIFLRQLFLSDIAVFDKWINQHIFLYLKITIVAAVLSSLMFVGLFQAEFPKLMPKYFLKVYSALTIPFALFVIIGPIYPVSASTHIFQIVVLSALLYILFLVLKSIRTAQNEKRLIAVGLLFFIFSVGIEALIFNRYIYSEYMLHYGLVLFILFESYAFWVDFSETNRQNIELNKKLESNNKNLQKLVKEKIQEATEAKEREIFSVMVKKASTDKLLIQLNDSIEKLKENKGNNSLVINNMQSIIQQSIKEEDIDEHLLHFRKLHPNFFGRLNTLHPSLTNNEIKLCAYLKLNLSHKDIADILHIQPESVRKAKTRMRKKMGLSSDQEILEYLYRIDF